MPTAVLWFATDAFVDSDRQREERVNENIGGAALAHWLSDQLQVAGFAAGEPFAEDHGWDFEIKTENGTYLIVCTIEDVSDEERQACVQINVGKAGRAPLDPGDAILKRVTTLLEGQGAIIDPQ